MRSVGEVMGIGRTFPRRCLKAIASLEGGWPDVVGLVRPGPAPRGAGERDPGPAPAPSSRPCAAAGTGRDQRASRGSTAWFLDQLDRHRVPLRAAARRAGSSGHTVEPASCSEAPSASGSPTLRLAELLGCRVEEAVAARRQDDDGIAPTFKRVDTCAAEFESHTPYLYSTYEDEDEAGESAGPIGSSSGQRPEPHRAGPRVRLLLLPRGLRGARGGAHLGDDQLQPRDGEHRLRHVGQAVLRADAPRARAAPSSRASAPRGRSCSSAARRRSSSPTSIGPVLGTDPECHRPVRGPRALQRRFLKPAARSPSRRAPLAHSETEAMRTPPSGSATRCWCGRRTCSAGGRCAICYDDRGLRARRHATPCAPPRATGS